MSRSLRLSFSLCVCVWCVRQQGRRIVTHGTNPKVSPIYVGNSRSGFAYTECSGSRPVVKCSGQAAAQHWVTHDAEPLQHVVTPQGRFDRPCGPFTCLRSTTAWIELERTISGWDVAPQARTAPNRLTPIAYAGGGTYVISRAAVAAMARHQCVRRVSRIECEGWSVKDPRG